MPIYPGADQRGALATLPANKPVYMLNLLKYRDAALYENPTETQKKLTGREAYKIYGKNTAKCIEKVGGKVVFYGKPALLYIGNDGDFPYDDVIIVEYPSKDAFMEMQRMPEFQSGMKDRQAGLDYQLLVGCLAEDFRGKI